MSLVRKMSLEPEEFKIHKKINLLSHRERVLADSRKELPKEDKRVLESLLKQRSVDPVMTIQIRQSTVERLRQANISIKGEGNGQSYDTLLNHLIEAAENERKERNKILNELIDNNRENRNNQTPLE